MCILDEIGKIPCDFSKPYYQSFEDAVNESYSRGVAAGIKKGRKKAMKKIIEQNIAIGYEEAYMKFSKAFGIPYEEIKEKTNSLKK